MLAVVMDRYAAALQNPPLGCLQLVGAALYTLWFLFYLRRAYQDHSQLPWARYRLSNLYIRLLVRVFLFRYAAGRVALPVPSVLAQVPPMLPLMPPVAVGCASEHTLHRPAHLLAGPARYRGVLRGALFDSCHCVGQLNQLLVLPGCQPGHGTGAGERQIW